MALLHPLKGSSLQESRGGSYATGALLIAGAVLNFAGIFPEYNQNTYAIAEFLRLGLVMNIGIELVLVAVGLAWLLATDNHKISYGAIGAALAIGGFTFSIRFGEIAGNIADGEDGAWGWWLQSIGDFCAFTAGITAFVWLVRCGTKWVDGRAEILLPAVVGVIAIVASKNSVLLDGTITGSNGRTSSGPFGKIFDEVTWSESGLILLWATAALVALIAPFVSPRIIGAGALAATTACIGVIEVLAPWSGAWGPQEMNIGDMTLTATFTVRPEFGWTVAGWVGLLIATGFAFAASNTDDGTL